MHRQRALGVVVCLSCCVLALHGFSIRRKYNHRLFEKRDREYVSPLVLDTWKRRYGSGESAFVILTRLMTRQGGQAPADDDDALVDRLFRLFDMNDNNFIERNEFKAMMMLLGVINPSSPS